MNAFQLIIIYLKKIKKLETLKWKNLYLSLIFSMHKKTFIFSY